MQILKLPTDRPLASYIDHTLLRSTATEDDIIRLCEEAIGFGFRAVCVNECYVPCANRILTGSDIGLAAVVGFPLGATSTRTKIYEAAACIESGASELDVVLNAGMVKSENYRAVRRELEELRRLNPDTILKLILETCFLDDREKRTVCAMAMDTGWDFVKTSTGFGTGGATLADVGLMREAVGSQMQVKASGGIRDIDFALALIAAGADRLGTSSGIALIHALNQLNT
jgi:deoxyribose-phosphate aldolase